MSTKEASLKKNRQTQTTLLEFLDNGVALIRLSFPDDKNAYLTLERLDSLAENIKKVKQTRPPGLVITGPSGEVFSSGLEKKFLHGINDSNQAEDIARKAQAIADEIASLPFKTVAAIGGSCLGGGCEIALACTYRLISDNKLSVIGFPDISLGMTPSFGGSQRLARMIGLAKSLYVFRLGKALRPRKALQIGLVNEITPTHSLLDRSKKVAAGLLKTRDIKIGLLDRIGTFTSVGRAVVKNHIDKKMPYSAGAINVAFKSITQTISLGLEQGLKVGLALEAKEFARVLTTSETKSQLRLSLLFQSARQIGSSAKKELDQVSAVVLGAGRMGTMITKILAKGDCNVVLKDISEEAVSYSASEIKAYVNNLSDFNETERSFILNRLEVTTRDTPNIGNANIVIEAVPEDFDLKMQALTEICRTIPDDSIIATKAASFSVTELAMALPNPSRVIGVHFLPPIDQTSIVEIVASEVSSNRALVYAAQLASKLGKAPIIVKDSPGFLLNRMMASYFIEALHLLDEGYLIHDIDEAALGFGFSSGPLHLMDQLGFNNVKCIFGLIEERFGERLKAPDHLTKLINANRRGKGHGGGFYSYNEADKVVSREAKALLQCAGKKRLGSLRDIAERLVMNLLNEAVRTFDQGIAGVPGPDAASQVDLGSVFGLGFPGSKGGILSFADSLGINKVHESLKKLEESFGVRFKPAPGILQRVSSGRKFTDAAEK